MRKFTLNIFTLSLGLAVMPMVEAAPTAQQQLLEQVRLGEATHREDLVQQSLYRLELIDPNNPDVVAARFRSLLRQGDIDGAQKQLDRLSQLAPSSNAYKSSPNAACKTTVWHSRQRHWKTRANGRRRQHFSGNDWRWTPAAYGLLTDFRRISGRPDNAARPIR